MIITKEAVYLSFECSINSFFVLYKKITNYYKKLRDYIGFLIKNVAPSKYIEKHIKRNP